MGRKLGFGETYSERLTLATGEQVRLRLVRPADKERMRKAFTELSAPSRFKRFFIAKPRLSDEELQYFTEMDGVDHFALAAIEIDGAGNEGAVVGVARCARLTADSDRAEVAITVIDRMQRRGIGRIFLERLIRAATERGISRFRFECLAHNREVQRLLKKVCRVIDERYDREVMIAEADLAVGPTDSYRSAIQAYLDLLDLLRALAIQTFEAQMDLAKSSFQGSMEMAGGGMNLFRGSEQIAAAEAEG